MKSTANENSGPSPYLNIATRRLRYDDPMKIKRLIRTMDAGTTFEGKFRRMFLLTDAHEC